MTSTKTDGSTVTDMKFGYFGRELEGFDHLYNSTYLNERQVELAIAFDFLTGVDITNTLEVGNVLAWYDVGGHVVVDRYEEPTGLQHLLDWPYYQVDVFDIATEVGSSWDAIVAISTLEHVAFDMDPAADRDLDRLGPGDHVSAGFAGTGRADAGHGAVRVPPGTR